MALGDFAQACDEVCLIGYEPPDPTQADGRFKFGPNDFPMIARRQFGCDPGTRAECHITPRSNLAVPIECPFCDGVGCDGCNGRGELAELPWCPQRFMREVGGVIELLNYYTTSFRGNGLLPAAGGMLDQTAVFIEAMDVCSRRDALVMNRRLRRPGEG